MKKSSPRRRTDYLIQGKLYTRAQLLEMPLAARIKAEPAVYKFLVLAAFMLIGFEMGCAV